MAVAARVAGKPLERKRRGGIALLRLRDGCRIKAVARNHHGFSGNCATFALVLNNTFGGDGSYLIVDSGHYQFADHVGEGLVRPINPDAMAADLVRAVATLRGESPEAGSGPRCR
jgi:hypothetical protein